MVQRIIPCPFGTGWGIGGGRVGKKRGKARGGREEKIDVEEDDVDGLGGRVGTRREGENRSFPVPLGRVQGAGREGGEDMDG